MADVDLTIIGGGIVGCAAADLAGAAGLSTVLLEKGPAMGGGVTSRNSEVAHGGMYYRPGSLKAQCCVEGRRALAAFCREQGVGYRECGKLIVAVTDDETGQLQRLLDLGRNNGVEDLELLDAAQVARLEPEVRAVAALWSPRTAVLDGEGTARAFARRARERGVEIMTGAEAVGLVRDRDGWRVTVAPPDGGGREGWTHTSGAVINAAGLGSDRVAALAGLDVDALGWRLRWVKGNYFGIDPRHHGRVSRLVYPVPPRDGSSLGVHLCIDLAGRLRLGPDVEPLEVGAAEDYRVDPARGAAFLAGGRRFLPFLEDGDLTPDMCGLRPRRVAWWTDGHADFVIHAGAGDHAGLVNLVGIESPGLTAAPAVARRAVDLVLAAR